MKLKWWTISFRSCISRWFSASRQRDAWLHTTILFLLAGSDEGLSGTAILMVLADQGAPETRWKIPKNRMSYNKWHSIALMRAGGWQQPYFWTYCWETPHRTSKSSIKILSLLSDQHSAFKRLLITQSLSQVRERTPCLPACQVTVGSSNSRMRRWPVLEC